MLARVIFSIYYGSLTTHTMSKAGFKYCHVLRDYTPAKPTRQRISNVDLEVEIGEVVTILTIVRFRFTGCHWRGCKTRDGRLGYLPESNLEKLDPESNECRPIELGFDTANGSLPATRETQSNE